MRTVVYVDGYNLYYGLLKGGPNKWLDLFTLFRDHVLDHEADLLEVRYYTAPVLGRMCDNPDSGKRQRTYLQALRKMYTGKIVIVEGTIQSSRPFQRLVSPIPSAPLLQKVQVWDFNEKKTDVNLASDLLAGAWTGSYEQAVLCSNDTDLEGALSTLRKHHPAIRIGLVAPVPSQDHRHIAQDLKQHTDWSKKLSTAHLEKAQLPDKIPHTAIRRPPGW